MQYLLGFLNPKNIAIMLGLAVLAYFGFTYWHRGQEIQTLQTEKTLLQASLKSSQDAAKACSDGVTALQAEAFERETQAKLAMEQAKKEADDLRSQAEDVLVSTPGVKDVSAGYSDSANALLNRAIDQRGAK